MTHSDWVASNGSGAPPALLDRARSVLAANSSWDALPTADALLRAGEELLVAVVQRGSELSRDAALDLLAADAFVTWAFEAAATEPGTISYRAGHTMKRIRESGS